MSYFEWNEKFDLKINEMNEQHRELIHLMNQLYDLVSEKKERSEIGKVLDALATYTIKHFKEEEEFMKKIEFPQYEVHSIVHQNLLKTFNEHLNAFKAGKDLDEAFFIFLKTWLYGHIQGVDIKYSDYHLKKAA